MESSHQKTFKPRKTIEPISVVFFFILIFRQDQIGTGWGRAKRFMLKTVAMVNLKCRWLIDQISIVGKIALAGLLLASCIVPVPYGAYYYPTNPEKSQYVWIMRNNEGTGAPETLRMRSDGCFMDLRAIADEENFIFSRSQEEWGNAGKYRIHVHNEPSVLEDLDSGSQRDISTFRRVFRGQGPALGLEEAVNLKSLIPGFCAVMEIFEIYENNIHTKQSQDRCYRFRCLASLHHR